MRKAEVFFHNISAGILEETEPGKAYRFIYKTDYSGPPVSLTMPVKNSIYEFNRFPSFFEGLLPEGLQLESLLRIKKIDRNDLFSQLMAVGADVIGAAVIKEIK
ncbi:HipA kinase-like N-terminal domain-containing protein [Desulfonema limicola]|uniref:HipA kinase-like N-terminal domain-containing protein n=1 Tax=Desulfonema limicola TaxID=45656 RepID=A0A975BA50_9BACT|nr:HipA N-terminal domain-containing protein [Desulfonema limicola]QTA81638.1 HipA kinase-like N-terminal domain-containing protein [Desulfonema limicola]